MKENEQGMRMRMRMKMKMGAKGMFEKSERKKMCMGWGKEEGEGDEEKREEHAPRIIITKGVAQALT